jgi:hypothetical protein
LNLKVPSDTLDDDESGTLNSMVSCPLLTVPVIVAVVELTSTMLPRRMPLPKPVTVTFWGAITPLELTERGEGGIAVGPIPPFCSGRNVTVYMAGKNALKVGRTVGTVVGRAVP